MIVKLFIFPFEFIDDAGCMSHFWLFPSSMPRTMVVYLVLIPLEGYPSILLVIVAFVDQHCPVKYSEDGLGVILLRAFDTTLAEHVTYSQHALFKL